MHDRHNECSVFTSLGFRKWIIGFILIFYSGLLFADGSFSGSWYNPERDGEGFHIEILDNDQALVIWFTFPGETDPAQAEQAWILGTGTVDGEFIFIQNAFKVRGPVFGQTFNPDDRVTDEWGDITIQFYDQNSGIVAFEGSDGSGATEIVRITGLIDPEETGGLPAGVSGAWYNPETDGQGWFVEIISKTQALVYWFTYDGNGNQAWNLGVGDIIGNSIVLADSQSGKNTNFGNQFDAGDVVRETFAGFTLSLDNCGSGIINYYTADGESSGSLPVVRITELLGTDCEGLPGPEDGTVKIMADTSDPLVLTHEGPDGLITDLFGSRNDSGITENISGGRMRLPNGETMRFYFDQEQNSLELMDEQSGLRIVIQESQDGLISMRAEDSETGTLSEVSDQFVASGLMGAALKSSHTMMAEATRSSNTQAGPVLFDASVEVELCGQPADPDSTKVQFVGGRADIPEADWNNPKARTEDFRIWDADGYQAGKFTRQLKFDGSDMDDLAKKKACESSLDWLWDNACPLVEPATGISGLLCVFVGLKNQSLGVKCGLAVAALAGIAGARCTVADANKQICENIESSERKFGNIFDVWAEAQINTPYSYADGHSGPTDLPPGGGAVELPKINIQTEKPVIIDVVPEPAEPTAGEIYDLKVEVGCKDDKNFTNFYIRRNGEFDEDFCTVVTDNLCWFENLSTQGGATVDQIEILDGPEPDGKVVATKEIKLKPANNPMPTFYGGSFLATGSAYEEEYCAWNGDWKGTISAGPIFTAGSPFLISFRGETNIQATDLNTSDVYECSSVIGPLNWPTTVVPNEQGNWWVNSVVPPGLVLFAEGSAKLIDGQYTITVEAVGIIAIGDILGAIQTHNPIILTPKP